MIIKSVSSPSNKKTWELDFWSESLIWPKIIILKRWGLEFISSLRIKAKYLFFYHLFLTWYFYPPRFSHSLGLFPLNVFLSSSYREVSKPLFLLSESKVITVGIPSDIRFLVTIILFSFWLCWQWHFSLLSLASSSSSAFGLCYHNQQMLQPLHMESVLREVSHSTCHAFCSIFASCLVILSVSLIATKMDT